MLNSAKHEILNAHKFKNIEKIQHLSGSDNHRMLFFLFIKAEMPTIVGISTFIRRKNFMLSWVEHEKVLKPRGQINIYRSYDVFFGGYMYVRQKSEISSE